MRYDDRLRTVLAQPAQSSHDRAVRWRQLVELVANASADTDGELVDQAIACIAADAAAVDERQRSATALAIARLPLSPKVVAAFAADSIPVAAPILANARLTASEWKSVAAAASEECRAFISVMRSGETAAPAPAAAPPSAASALPAPPPPDRSAPETGLHAHTVPSISDLVARIERLRETRDSTGQPEEPAKPESPRLFRWECNESGQIDWVDGAPRGALVGATIAGGSAGRGVNRAVQRAFAARTPFHDGILDLPDGCLVEGRWTISGVPAFERSTGRFAGYRGLAERPKGDLAGVARPSDPDSLRELAHEIRTPLNAIIGFGEIIAGEYFGPAESRFRERAGDIVAQARLLLSAVEDLDFAAKIRSSASAGSRTDIGALMEQLAPAIRDEAAARNVEIEAPGSNDTLEAAIEDDIAERLILRMCSAVIGQASSGESLRLGTESRSGSVTVSITRPEGLGQLFGDDVFGAANDASSPGFPLRLARGLAQTAGVSLVASEHRISLIFPSA